MFIKLTADQVLSFDSMVGSSEISTPGENEEVHEKGNFGAN